MGKYIVRIIEQLSRQIEVEAENAECACKKVKQQYDKGNIVLNAEDFDAVNFF